MVDRASLKTTARIALAVAALGTCVTAYIAPLRKGEGIAWLRSPYHPEWYDRAGLVFTGYAYPLLVLALFALTLATSLMPANRRLVLFASTFTLLGLCLLALVGLIFSSWLALTPMF